MTLKQYTCQFCNIETKASFKNLWRMDFFFRNHGKRLTLQRMNSFNRKILKYVACYWSKHIDLGTKDSLDSWKLKMKNFRVMFIAIVGSILNFLCYIHVARSFVATICYVMLDIIYLVWIQCSSTWKFLDAEHLVIYLTQFECSWLAIRARGRGYGSKLESLT